MNSAAVPCVLPSGRNNSQQRSSAATYLDAFAKHQRNRGLAESTISISAGDIRRFHEAVKKSLLSVDRRDLPRVFNRWQAQGLSNSTICRRASVLRSFYDFLYLRGLIRERPTDNMAIPKGWVRVMRAPDFDELERVIAAIGCESPSDLRDKAVLLLLRDSGIRSFALSRLLVADIDCEHRWITIRQDKGKKQHVVPMSMRASEALRKYLQIARPYFVRERGTPYVFPGNRIVYMKGRQQPRGGDRLTREAIWHIAKRWTERVLGHTISPHKWRAGCLTEGAQNGMDIVDLMNLAGHSDPSTTDRYIRHQLGHLKERFYATHPRARRERQ